MSDDRLSVLLAGDALITRPWSHVEAPFFLKLVELIRAADVSIVNLETVIHEFKGYAQADSGGVHMHSPPEIAGELKWAGFDMLSHANNHAFDYGSTAVLETVEHAEKAGLVIAGSGKDLQAARAPRYFRSRSGTLALVAMASTFVPYGKASLSRGDLHGRPGLNPLALLPEALTVVLPPKGAAALRSFGSRFPGSFEDLGGGCFKFGIRVREGARPRVYRGCWPVRADAEANLAAISASAETGAFVVASIHAHAQGTWLREFAGRAIDHGASVVFIHGPHRVRGLELRNGKPIFYSLGNFVNETGHIARFPSETYEMAALGGEATAQDVRAEQAKRTSLRTRRSAFVGLVATLSVSAGKVGKIRLHPLDLRLDRETERGRPQLADPAVGREIVAALQRNSRVFGTNVRYDPGTNSAEIDCA